MKAKAPNARLPLCVSLLGNLLACASPSPDAAAADGSEDDALVARSSGASALLAAVRDSAPPRFLHCRTASGVSPKFDLDVYTDDRVGSAVVLVRRFSGPTAIREALLEGTLDGIPRAGDLQGSVTFKLGAEEVAFDYYAEQPDEPNEIVFRGEKIALVCNAV